MDRAQIVSVLEQCKERVEHFKPLVADLEQRGEWAGEMVAHLVFWRHEVTHYQSLLVQFDSGIILQTESYPYANQQQH